jgi:hypothetical protein
MSVRKLKDAVLVKIGNLEKTQHKAVTLILTHNGNTVIVNYVVIANLYR